MPKKHPAEVRDRVVRITLDRLNDYQRIQPVVATPVLAIKDGESLSIYSPVLGTYSTNLTGTPNWPT